MRPTKHRQSALSQPLNDILGTEASVRVLRTIYLSDIPTGVADLARHTALQASGLPIVCARLEDLGVIESVGRGRNRQFRRASRGSLPDALTNLFRAERDRAQAIMSEVRQVVQSASSTFRAAWIEGPVARGEDRPSDPIIVTVLASPTGVEEARLAVWGQLLGVQANRDISVELRVETEADLVAADSARIAELERAVPLVGVPPMEIARPRPAARTGPRKKLHGNVDSQLLRLAHGIAAEIRRDPSIVEGAREFIERRLHTASPGERLELVEWKGVLERMSVSRIRRLLVEESARGRRLRQSLPFAGMPMPDRHRRVMPDAR